MDTITLRATPEQLIDRANEVSVFDVLQDWFGITHPREGRSYKDRCPFGWEHPDGGVDKGWRTYPPTNSSFCFVMHGFMGPVRLVAIQEGKKPLAAAKVILQKYDVLKPRGWRERFRELQVEQEQRDRVSPSWVVAALNEGLRADPRYEAVQFTPEFNAAIERELEGLGALLESGQATDVRVREWYSTSKARLMGLLEGQGG